MITLNPSQLPILIRREFWEHRWAFVYAPSLVTVLGIILILMAIIFAAEIDGSRLFTDSAIREFAERPMAEKVIILRTLLLSNVVHYNGLLQIVMFFYLVGALYDERKDRSILFWKSLPVSDGTTVLSKLLTAGIAVPVVYMLFATGMQLLMLLIASIYAWQADIGVWSNVWQPSGLPGIWANVLIAIPVQLLWVLPLYGWFVLVSAFAPRLPWLIALAIPGLAGLFQNYLSVLDNLKLPETNIWILFWERIGHGILPISVNINDDGEITEAIIGSLEGAFTMGETLARLGRLDMWVGIIIGLALLFAAVKLRARATDS